MGTINLFTNKFKETRSKEEFNRIKNILSYIRTSKYPKKVNENVVLDVLTLINDGFENGQNLDEIIGVDDQKFIDEIYANLNKKPYKVFTPRVIIGIISFSLLEILFSLIEYNKGIFDFKFLFFRIFIYIAMIGLDFYYEYHYKHCVYDKEKKRKYRYILMVLYILLFMLLYVSIVRMFGFGYYMMLYLVPLYFSVKLSFKE